MNKEIKATRNFGMAQKENPTKVFVTEFSDGSIGFNLETARDGMEPLSTSFTLSPRTLNLLSEAMYRAAHLETAWNKIPEADQA
ncbi:MAG: hypothetical protein WC657_07515 [Candidatus Paceibacterota bacterium]|jgi:hypothetical protein